MRENLKKLLVLAASIATFSLPGFAQGTFSMVWYDGVHGITVGSPGFPRTPGWLLGAEYSAEAMIGPAGSCESCLTPVPESLVTFDLNGPTSASGTAANGSGQFYLTPAILTTFPLGNAAIQIRAWYNGGRYSTFEEAIQWGMNIGQSPVMTINLKSAIDPTVQSLTDIGMQPFYLSNGTPIPGPIDVTGIQVTNGTVTINFHDVSVYTWSFDVLASTNASGPYLPVSAVFTHQGGFNNYNYQATLSPDGDTQFYKIKRNYVALQP